MKMRGIERRGPCWECTEKEPSTLSNLEVSENIRRDKRFIWKRKKGRMVHQ